MQTGAGKQTYAYDMHDKEHSCLSQKATAPMVWRGLELLEAGSNFVLQVKSSPNKQRTQEMLHRYLPQIR
jgi:hypothetical protein